MTTAGKLAWGVVIAAGILHTDLWAWDNTELVFGFVPWALAYHAGVSLLAAIAWALVVHFDWPDGVEEWAAGDGTDTEERADAER